MGDDSRPLIASSPVVGQPIAHDSAGLHVSGRAAYTDDIPEPRDLLHAAIGLAERRKDLSIDHELRGQVHETWSDDLDATFVYPGAPYKLPASPWTLSRRAPHLGEHTEEVLSELS